MVVFTKPESYELQIVLYLKNKEYAKAYSLSKEFVECFNSEMVAHFLLMKSAFWLKKFDEAIKEGRKAFNLSHGDDLLTCAIIISNAYYLNGNPNEAYNLLVKIQSEGNAEVEKLLFLYSIALNNNKEAIRHIDNLYKLNRKLAKEFIIGYLLK